MEPPHYVGTDANVTLVPAPLVCYTNVKNTREPRAFSAIEVVSN
jgi:hypothetical protein